MKVGNWCLAAVLLPVAAMGVFAVTPARAQSSADGQILIKPEEARLPNATDSIVERGLTRGPGIEQVSPDPSGITVAGPVPLKVRFIPRNEVPIDPRTVRITYLKMRPIDLTERVRMYLGAAGIDMGQAVVPPGVHVLRVEVRDVQGRTGTAMVKIVVAEPQ